MCINLIYRNLNRVEQRLKHYYWTTYFSIISRRSPDGVEYIWKRTGSRKLIIVFSAMGKGKYNYYRSLRNAIGDQLYIRDCWANNASYYWYEGGQDYPEKYTQNLIDNVIHRGQYTEIFTVGSSKGGTAALYFGMKNNVDLVYAGACQYRVGDYLSRHQYKTKPEQWELVVGGKPNSEWIRILDSKLEMMIESRKNGRTKVNLLYSTKEHTYLEHIVPLIHKLEECNISHKDQIESFTEHSSLGQPFKKAIMDFFQ